MKQSSGRDASPSHRGKHYPALTPRSHPGRAAGNPRGNGGRLCPPGRDLGVPVPEVQGSRDFGQNHSPEVERRVETLHSEPSPWNRPEPPFDSLLVLIFCALLRHLRPLARDSQSRAPLVAPWLPPPARGTGRRARTPGAGYKGGAAAADCGLKLRPKEPGQGLVGHSFRTRAPAGVTPAPPPTTHSSPEPSAQPAPAPAQALTEGPRTGSRSPSVSIPAPAGARPTSKAGSPTGTPRASAFAAAQRNAQFGPGNTDAQ